MRQAMREGNQEFIDAYGGQALTVALPEEYEIYATAYIMLDRDRSHHEHIPWSKFVEYGRYYGLNRDQIDWLIEIGFRVDNAIVAERQKKAPKGGNT